MVIGDVEIGAHANIWFDVVIRGDDVPIRIAAGANIQDGTVVHVTHDVPSGGEPWAGHPGALFPRLKPEEIEYMHWVPGHCCRWRRSIADATRLSEQTRSGRNVGSDITAKALEVLVLN